jgi:hypothetical protein
MVKKSFPHGLAEALARGFASRKHCLPLLTTAASCTSMCWSLSVALMESNEQCSASNMRLLQDLSTVFKPKVDYKSMIGLKTSLTCACKEEHACCLHFTASQRTSEAGAKAARKKMRHSCPRQVLPHDSSSPTKGKSLPRFVIECH